MENKKNVFKEEREKFVKEVIESLEKNQIPWEKDWKNSGVRPYNVITNNGYKNSNNLKLTIIGSVRGYDDPRWATFNQAKSKGWGIEKGAQGVKIEVFKMYDTKTKKDLDLKMYNALNLKEKKEYEKYIYPIAKTYTVFNAEQIKGITPLEKKELTNDNIDYKKIDNIIKNSGVEVIHSGDKAFYNPQEDKIVLPKKELFKDENSYYATALHEIAHSTGHSSRMNRNLNCKFGSKSYAEEELKAEFSSVFIGQEKGLNYTERHLENNKAYIQSWVSILKNDPNILFTAAKEAEGITQRVLGYEKEKFKEKTKEKSIEIER